jgi:hypothetical protein
MRKSGALVTHVVEVEVLPENKSLKQLEVAAAVLNALRGSAALGAVPISASPRIRSLLAQMETDIQIIRKTTVGSGR